MKGTLPDGQNVGPAILVFFQCLNDQGRAAYTRNLSVADKHNSKTGMRINAVARHLTITQFKNVQRQRLAGEKYNVQRKQRNPSAAHDRHLAGPLSKLRASGGHTRVRHDNRRKRSDPTWSTGWVK